MVALFSAAGGYAATITANADCLDGNRNGELVAFCTGPGGYAAAQTFPPFTPRPPYVGLPRYPLQPSSAIAVAAAHAEHLNFTPDGWVTASATFSALYQFTVTGGVGSGFVEPCMISGGYTFGAGVGGGAGASFGTVGVGDSGQPNNDRWGTCQGYTPRTMPFTFDVPQIVPVTLQAYAGVLVPGYSADGVAVLNGLRFYDSSMNLLPNVTFTLTPAEPLPIPEPATLGLAAAAICALCLRRRRDFGRLL